MSGCPSQAPSAEAYGNESQSFRVFRDRCGHLSPGLPPSNLGSTFRRHLSMDESPIAGKVNGKWYH